MKKLKNWIRITLYITILTLVILNIHAYIKIHYKAEFEKTAEMEESNTGFYFYLGMGLNKLAEKYGLGKWGYINRKGEIVASAKWDYASPFYKKIGNKLIARVLIDKKTYYINDKFEVIDDKFKELFFANIIPVRSLDIPEKYGSWRVLVIQPITPGRAYGRYGVELERKDKIKMKRSDRRELLLYEHNTKYGLIDRSGNIVVEAQYDFLFEYQNGYAPYFEGNIIYKIGKYFAYNYYNDPDIQRKINDYQRKRENRRRRPRIKASDFAKKNSKKLKKIGTTKKVKKKKRMIKK